METNHQLNEIYTLGIWIVKPEKGKAFINEWTLFAKWSAKNVSGIGKGYLLQDNNNSLRFMSFGTWDNESVIQNWRNSIEFKNFITVAKDLCDDFQPNTLTVVSTSD